MLSAGILHAYVQMLYLWKSDEQYQEYVTGLHPQNLPLLSKDICIQWITLGT